MKKVKNKKVSVVLETAYFTLYSDGKMVGKMESLRELAQDTDGNFWEILNEEIFEYQCNTDDLNYVEVTGDMPFCIGLTSAPAFFIGSVRENKPEKTKFKHIFAYMDYQLHFWQDILLKNGEVWFQKV